MTKRRIVGALLSVLVASSLWSCNSGSSRSKLPFQALDLGIGNYTGTSVAFYVLTDSNPSLPSWLSTEPPWLESVDFSTDFVVLVRVPPPLNAFLITDVWQIDKTVYIRAQFVTDIPGIIGTEPGSPGETVLVLRKNLHQFGDITFKLLDDYGKERASVTAFISHP